MSTNSNFPPSGSPPVAGTSFDPNAPSAGASVPGPAPEQNQASYQRDSASPVPPPQPDSSRNDYPVPEAPDALQWSDEDYVRYAEERFGHKFSASAARAFSEFDPSSHDVQAAEFYRYVDEHFKRYGYF